jgi:small GTP-binding protein
LLPRSGRCNNNHEFHFDAIAKIWAQIIVLDFIADTIESTVQMVVGCLFDRLIVSYLPNSPFASSCNHTAPFYPEISERPRQPPGYKKSPTWPFIIKRTFDFSLKAVVVGDSGVGKTCLLMRYFRDVFDPECQLTLGVEFMTKIFENDNQQIQLQLWDTAGQELFRSVTWGYYRGSAGAFLVFDITNHDSFDHIGRWLHDVRDVARSDVVTILLGNKADLKERRDVEQEEAETFATENHMWYFETSAKTGQNIINAISACVSTIQKLVTDGVYEVTPSPDEGQFLPEESQNQLMLVLGNKHPVFT